MLVAYSKGNSSVCLPPGLLSLVELGAAAKPPALWLFVSGTTPCGSFDAAEAGGSRFGEAMEAVSRGIEEEGRPLISGVGWRRRVRLGLPISQPHQ